MTKKITANNDLNLNGMLTVSNDFRLEDNLNVNNIDISTNLTVEGNLKSEHVLFTKQTTIHDLLDASNIDVSNAVVNNDTVVENSIRATGDVSSNDVSCNNLFITNELTATHIDISNNLLIRPQPTELDVQNKATVLKTVDVSYVRVYTDMDVSENMVIDKNMDISAGKLNKHLDVSGIYVKKRGTVKNLKIREKAVMKGQVDISGNLNMINRLFASSMVGMIGWFASENIPPGWLVCDGGKYTKALYTDLSNCIGNTYNAQDTDGDISFNVPDLTNQFVRSIYTDIDTDTDIRLGAKENYKTGKPTGDSNFQVTLSGEHIHILDPSGEHFHEYKKDNVTNITKYNAKIQKHQDPDGDVQEKPTKVNEIINIRNDYSLNSNSSTANFSDIASTSYDSAFGTDGKVTETVVTLQITLTLGPWSASFGGSSSTPKRVTYNPQVQRKQRTIIGYKEKKWKETSDKFIYFKDKDNGSESESNAFLKDDFGIYNTEQFDISGNHKHIVKTDEGAIHHHTLSNWHNESVPKHTILLPCIKY